MKQEIEKLLQKAVKNMGISDALVLVEAPKEKNHGDYATSIALVVAKKLGKNPNEVAKEIIANIGQQNMFQKIEVAGPGFINFYLAKEVFVENIQTILKKKDFGKNQNLKNKKIIVEYTDPNILKEFHIGHLMSNAIGESISRIFDFQGATVKRATWQSDVGLSIAKAVWGKMKQSDLSWQEAYVMGTKQYDSEPLAKEEITALNKKIFQRSDKAVNKIYDQGKAWSLGYFDAIYKKLGSTFDDMIFESQAVDLAKNIVSDGLKKKIFETGENGAVIFKGEKFGLHTRVFINSEGLPTYEAKEMALAKMKYDAYKYDSSVVITGNEINEYFKVMLRAMSQIFPELEKKTKHVGHGMMRLPEGKMSSRTGKVVTFEFLLGEVEKLVLEKMKDRALPEKEKKDIIEKVAIGALKYSILKQSTGSDIIFDFEKSISFEGDSGPYLQYSYARANSILKKATAEKIKPVVKKAPSEVSALEKMMLYFPEIVEKSAKEFQPHYIATYITQLAHEFNSYYAHHKIVDKLDLYSPYKVALTQAFANIINNGLWLLGIPVPETM